MFRTSLSKFPPSTSTSCICYLKSYATKAPAKSAASKKTSGARGSKPGEGAGDSRVETIKKVLFESDPSDEARLEAVKKVVPSLEAHETITNAWRLRTRHVREAHEAELARKYQSMRAAIDLLEQTDKTLWEKAVGGARLQNVKQGNATNARLEGLVPRELRVPMDSAGQAVLWDENWKAPVVVEAVKPKAGI